MILTRAKLTENETSFYRTILYHATSETHGQPWLRQAFYKLTPVAVLGSGTMAVDKFWRVYIDFDRMREQGATYAAGVLGHEVWHLLRKHHERFDRLPPAPAGYSQSKLGNIAGDLEINDDIRELLPNELLFPGVGPFEKYPADLVMEQYYTMVCNDAKPLSDKFEIKSAARPNKKDEQDGTSSADESTSSDNSNGDGSESDQESSESSSSSSQGEQNGDGEPNTDGEGLENSSDVDGTNAGLSGEDNDSADISSGESDNNELPDSDKPGDGSSSGNSSDVEADEQGSGASSSDAGSGAEGTTGSVSGNGSNGAKSDPGSAVKQPGPPKMEAPTCGSSAGNVQEYELGENDEEAPPLSADEVNETLDLVAKDIESFVPSKGVGSASGKLLARVSEWAKDYLAAKAVPWNQEFRGLFRTAYGDARGKLTYVRNRPARRQPVEDVFFPALRSPVPTVGIGIDVSGSNVGNLKLILEEVMNIMKASGVRGKQIQAFAVDVEASKTKTVQNPMLLLDDLPVGGGTKMTPGYERLAEMGKDISILFTDGLVMDYPEVAPPGRKRTRYITCIIGEEKMNAAQVKKAVEEIGSWSKVLPINLVSRDGKVSVSL